MLTCFPFAEQPTVSQPDKRKYTCVIGHTIDVVIFLIDEIFEQAVDVATMFTCTLFPPHPVALYIYVSHFHCWWQCWSASICCGSCHGCIHVGKLVSIVRLIVWHIAAAPLFNIYHSSYLSNSPTYGSSLSLWSFAEGVGRPMPVLAHVICFYGFSLPSTMTTTGSMLFSFRLPGLCGSGTYVFSSDNRTVEETWRTWRQLE